MSNCREVLIKNDSADRKREVLNAFLDTFIEKGLSETSVRDLSASINTQSAGMYYYFPNKEDAVIACAEEAAIRLENNLIAPALKDVTNPELLVKRLLLHAVKMAPTMKFFVQVCTAPKYGDLIRPTLDRLSERYTYYSELFAERIGCTKEELVPSLYMGVSVITNYMIFDDNSYIIPQMEELKQKISSLSQSDNLEM